MRSPASLLAALCAAFSILITALLGGCAGENAPAADTAETTTTTVVTTTTTTINGTITASEVIIREGPGFEYGAIGGLPQDEALTIVGHEGDWYRIEFDEGYGYVNAAYVDVEGQPNASEMIAQSTTVSRASTTSRTKPQSPTTTTAKTTKPGTTAAPDHIPDTAVTDAVND